MATIKRFYDLDCWKKSRELNFVIYKFTLQDAFKKDFALVNQIRRCSISIMANIAEGFGRKGNKEFIHFLSIAEGSLVELQSHLYIALDIEYLEKDDFDLAFNLSEDTQRLIYGFSEYLKKTEMKGIKFE
ncbi:MAG: four helix bundle protein [Bacteroidetes bacterium]|nr:four helix bundle protein [Bacteroidota bacterium]